MKAAYADPPYLGRKDSAFGAAHHYGALHPDAADYDRIETHAALIARLGAEFDCWALSLSSVSLHSILPLCPADVRIGAWVKPFASFKPNVNPAYCWEPVIFWGGRKHERFVSKIRGGKPASKIRDFVSVGLNQSLGFPGAKPAAVCWWIFDFLGLTPDDEFHDLFPGSGAVGRAWAEYCRANRNTPLFAGLEPTA